MPRGTLYLFFLSYFSLMYYISTTVPPLSPSLSVPSPLFLIHSSSVPLKKKDQFSPGMSIELCITKCNKIRHISSYKAWTRQPSKRKKGFMNRQKSQMHPLQLLGIHKSFKLKNHSVITAYTVPVCCFTLCEPL